MNPKKCILTILSQNLQIIFINTLIKYTFFLFSFLSMTIIIVGLIMIIIINYMYKKTVYFNIEKKYIILEILIH